MNTWQVAAVFSVAMVVLGCEERSRVTAESTETAPAATRPATSSPATTIPADLAAMLAPTTRPTTLSKGFDDLPARAATAPDPLASPAGALAFFLDSIRQQRWSDMRKVSFDVIGADRLEQTYTPMSRTMNAGGSVTVVDVREQENVAIGIFRAQKKGAANSTIFSIPLVRRYDQWKIQIGDPNPRRYTEQELANFVKLSEWAKQRVDELADGAPAAPSTTQAARQ